MFSLFKRKKSQDSDKYTITFRENELGITISAAYPRFTTLGFIMKDILSRNEFLYSNLPMRGWIFAEWHSYPRDTMLFTLPMSRRKTVFIIHDEHFLEHFGYSRKIERNKTYRFPTVNVTEPSRPRFVKLTGSEEKENALNSIYWQMDLDPFGRGRGTIEFVGDSWPDERDHGRFVEPILYVCQLRLASNKVLLIQEVSNSDIYDDRVYYGCPTAVMPQQMDDLRLREVEVVSYE